jgi:hypothetical protein
MGKLMDLLGISRCINGGRERERELWFVFHRSEPLGKKREPLWRIRKGINTPCLPMVT